MLFQNYNFKKMLIRFIKGNNYYNFQEKDRTDEISQEMVKLQRAQGECLGTKSRRRT